MRLFFKQEDEVNAWCAMSTMKIRNGGKLTNANLHYFRC